MLKLYTLAAAAILPLAIASAQQTLTLNDGTQVQGRLVSSTGNTIVFRSLDGDLRRFNVDQLQDLSFNAGGPYNGNGAGPYDGPNRGEVRRGQYSNTPPPAPGYQQPIYNSNPNGGYAQNAPPNPIYTRQTEGQNYTTWTTLPAGTQIAVRTNEQINSRSAGNGRTYTASIAQDILDSNGNVIVPQGSDAQLVVRNMGNNSVGLDLQSISVNGTMYQVNSEDIREEGNGRDGIGKNRRTGEFVGGGALLGTLLGAIAGGGKGALIGAAAGGAAGAGAEVLTKGESVRVPAETVLTFRLDTPLQLNQPR